MQNLYGGNVDNSLIRQQQQELERIRLRNIEETFQHIVKNKPELCKKHMMLYIRGKVSDKELDIFIDTGAQTTIMTKKFAEECGLLRLLDTRFRGTAHGVGSAPVLGRIHLMKITIGKKSYEHNLSVMDRGALHQLVLGLDFLKVHNCVIDLPRNLLRIGEDNEIEFLKEDEMSGGKSPVVHSPLGDFIQNQQRQQQFQPFQQQQRQQVQQMQQRQAQQQQTQQQQSQTNQNNMFNRVVLSDEAKKKVLLLTSNFFVSQEKAIYALQKANWNLELACTYLFV